MQIIKSFFLLLGVILFPAVTGLGQQHISPEKKALIQELRGLIEQEPPSFSASVPAVKAKETFTSLIEKDPELTNAQKQELKKYVAESGEHVEEKIREFFADKSIAKQISDEVDFQLFHKTFTDTELRELIAFYRTPTGQKAARFMATVDTQLKEEFGKVFGQRLKEFLSPIIQSETEQLRKRIREIKAIQKGG